MTNFLRSLKEELWNIRTIDLTRSTQRIVEKVFWLLIALAGTIWFCYFMAYQVELWRKNVIFISKAKVKLAEVNYPAVSFCSRKANKYGVAERLGNHLDARAEIDSEFLTWLRQTAINCSLDNIQKQELNKFGYKAQFSCLGAEIMSSDCQVGVL